jgi:hypothetical protein
MPAMKGFGRKLFNLAAVVSAVLTLAMATLWIRSEFAYDEWDTESVRPDLGQVVELSIATNYGRFLFARKVRGLHEPSCLDQDQPWTHLNMEDNPNLHEHNRLDDSGWIAISDPNLSRLFYISGHFWFPCSLSAIPPLVWLGKAVYGRRSLNLGLCPKCGYDLRATPDRCPECGTVRDGTQEAGAVPTWQPGKQPMANKSRGAR